MSSPPHFQPEAASAQNINIKNQREREREMRSEVTADELI